MLVLELRLRVIGLKYLWFSYVPYIVSIYLSSLLYYLSIFILYTHIRIWELYHTISKLALYLNFCKRSGVKKVKMGWDLFSLFQGKSIIFTPLLSENSYIYLCLYLFNKFGLCHPTLRVIFALVIQLLTHICLWVVKSHDLTYMILCSIYAALMWISFYVNLRFSLDYKHFTQSKKRNTSVVSRRYVESYKWGHGLDNSRAKISPKLDNKDKNDSKIGWQGQICWKSITRSKVKKILSPYHFMCHNFIGHKI